MSASFDFAQYVGQVGYPAYEPDDDEFDTGCTDDCPDDCAADHRSER